FQAQDHNALAISMVRFLVALPPSGTCYFAPNICSSQPELCARQKTAALRDFSSLYVRFGSGTDITRHLANVRFTPQSGQTHCSKNLFDHLVGALQQRLGNAEAERLRRLEIDHQLELAR